MSVNLDAENLKGPHKAAIFLLSMGEQFTSEIFSKLGPEEIKRLASTMSEIERIPPEALNKVVTEFLGLVEDKDRLDIQGGESFLRGVLGKLLDQDQADAIFREIADRRRELPFVWSRDVDVGLLAATLKEEHPQTIAMVLAHLPVEISADIMMGIPDEKKGDLAMRIATLGRIPDEIVRDVDQALRAGLADMGRSAKVGGLQSLVEIINSVNKATEDTIMEAIEEDDAEMAAEIRSMMFVFEDLLRVDDRGMREILKKVESQQLVLSMKTSSEEMKNKIMNNLSQRAAEMLKEDLEVMGPVRLAEVEEAQQAIIFAAKELEAEGTINLGGKGKEDVLV